MVDFVDEVNEDLRQQRFTQFWQKVGAYVVGVSVVIVLATVATVLWQNHVTKRQEAAAEAFRSAEKRLPAKEYELAAREFAAVADMQAEGFTALAQLKEAYAQVQAGDKAAALESYRAVVDDASADQGVRALARLYAAMLATDMGQPAADIRAYLEPLAKDNSNPFSSFAREQLALVTYEEGDLTAAKEQFASLAADMQAPASIRRRAQAQLTTIDRADD